MTIVPGDTLPDYELPDRENVPRRTREIRPDRALATPGPRDAWEAGDWAGFHGWEKRTATTPSSGVAT